MRPFGRHRVEPLSPALAHDGRGAAPSPDIALGRMKVVPKVTMFDPLLTLALSMHSGKGIYALLLGSGVSRTSGIPTGWEIVLDLISKVAHLQEEQPTDLVQWYVDRYG